MSVKKRNMTFNCLQALLILMVIDDHVSSRIGLLTSIFPYDSFFMPFFVFISGYFYKNRGVFQNLLHKMKTILLPFIIWNLIGSVIAFVLHHLDIVHWYWELNVTTVARVFYATGSLTTLTRPGWFALNLFYITIIYCFFKNCLIWLNPKSADFILLLLFCGAGMGSLWMCINHYPSNEILVAAYRVVFYLQFYHMGHMFARYWEKAITHFRGFIVCGICIAVNVALICVSDKSICFYESYYMKKFNSWYLPVVTSITGGLFWYEIMSYAAPLLSEGGRRNVFNIIGENTFTIMMTHLFFINIPNFFSYAQKLKGNPSFADFDIAAFQNSAWYRYGPKAELVGFFCGLIGSLAIVYGLNWMKYIFKTEKATYRKRI